MPIDPELLEILACPESHQPLARADAALIARLNEEVRSGRLRTRGGETVSSPITEALVREDRKYLYRIEDDIPIMLIEQSIELA